MSELEEQIGSVLAQEIQKEIDERVLLSILVEGGWTRVPFHFNNNTQAVDITEWCDKHIKPKQWERLSDSFVFCKKKDAEWFILRWS